MSEGCGGKISMLDVWKIDALGGLSVRNSSEPSHGFVRNRRVGYWRI